MKIIRPIIYLGFILSLLTLAYSLLGPWYKTRPLVVPISFEKPRVQEVPFSAIHEDDYNIEVKLKNLLPEQELDRITGAYGKTPPGGLLTANWEITTTSGQPVGKGSNRNDGFSFYSKDYRGFSAGTLHLRRGDYKLSLDFPGSQQEWNKLAPTVELAIRRQNLEYLQILFWVSLPLTVIFGFLSGLARRSSN